MNLPEHKTKIVCTIGPQSESVEVMERMIRAGMNVARLNFSHGDFDSHGKRIRDLRFAAREVGSPLAILADLPGPKMRIGMLQEEPIDLDPDDLFTLTTDDIVGDRAHVSETFPGLPRAVAAGDTLYLNDGLIQLEVVSVQGTNVQCRVIVGGELRSRKGLNLPGINLGIEAYTPRDRECLEFALEHGVDAVSQSFVQSADDVKAVREHARSLDKHPFIIAKIERSGALNHIPEILEAADGIMVARGDLGVEIPIEEIAIVQKDLIRQANLAAKPVITATQMLESMTDSRRPTRAESTDVANAILDGTDCVMLSGESAAGKYPVESVEMLARIARAVEPHRTDHAVRELLLNQTKTSDFHMRDLLALSVFTITRRAAPAVIIVPTRTGASARSISRFKLPQWIMGVSTQERTRQQLLFSYGVLPFHEPDHPDDWRTFARNLLASYGIYERLVVLTEGPSRKHPDTNHRVEIIEL
jgi:pyruvate kinase